MVDADHSDLGEDIFADDTLKIHAELLTQRTYLQMKLSRMTLNY